MKNRPDNRRSISFEKHGPISCSIITIILCIVFTLVWNLNIDPYFDNILNVAITFSTMLVGFVGVLLGILFSLRDRYLVELLFKYNTRETLKMLFVKSIFSGILVIGTSTILYLRKLFMGLIVVCKLSIVDILGAFWLASIVYMMVSTYIIAHTMIHIIFSTPEESEDTIELSDERKAELTKKYRREEEP